jgi:hypothetical protein
MLLPGCGISRSTNFVAQLKPHSTPAPRAFIRTEEAGKVKIGAPSRCFRDVEILERFKLRRRWARLLRRLESRIHHSGFSAEWSPHTRGNRASNAKFMSKHLMNRYLIGVCLIGIRLRGIYFIGAYLMGRVFYGRTSHGHASHRHASHKRTSKV